MSRLSISNERIWKSFNPDVQVTLSDLHRLQTYANHLQLLSHNNHYNNLRANIMCIPEEYTYPKGVFEG